MEFKIEFEKREPQRAATKISTEIKKTGLASQAQAIVAEIDIGQIIKMQQVKIKSGVGCGTHFSIFKTM